MTVLEQAAAVVAEADAVASARERRLDSIRTQALAVAALAEDGARDPATLVALRRLGFGLARALDALTADVRD